MTSVLASRTPSRAVRAGARPEVRGKFIYVNGEKLYVRGVTYGTFAPDERGNEFTDRARVDADFAAMAAHGINAVRTYTVPPTWLLDLAQAHGLYVMAGVAWEQHIAFLDSRRNRRAIEQRVRDDVGKISGHAALLCYVIGNEIPSSIVRWHGRRRIERYIRRLYDAAKGADPQALVAYVNYPSTEYLQLPFIDLVCFNVYLESRVQYERYLARLQNIAGERPLLMTEIGLDSRRHGVQAQADALGWQVRSAFAAGCAGVFVYAWTDEWHRGGFEIEDWDFGLTDRDRTPKPALGAVRAAYSEVPFPADIAWPRISVVVCSFNGQRTLRDCLEGLIELEYPNVEVIVVNDGSTDATPMIASEYGFRLISTENRGLSNARNTGMEAASGEIVAYTDDDARPDPHWLHYLAWTFMTTDHVGVGGPNIAPPGDGPIAECVANAPGGPLQVLLSDTVAEHIPGCNMAFRRDALVAINGFDPQYRAAGDDVDLCWRLQQRGGTLGFHAGAMVWHHRRNSLRMYWKQQQGYGKAEALLEAKWPERYNAAGHTTWAGRIYGRGLTLALGSRLGRIYQGRAGAAPFQPASAASPGLLQSLPLMPEWWLAVIALAAISALGALWPPLLLALPLLALAIGAPVAQAAVSAAQASFGRRPRPERMALHAVTFVMHLAQPIARLRGRLRHGLTPWRRRGATGLAAPWPHTARAWSETWRAQDDRVGDVTATLRNAGAVAIPADPYARYDIEVRGGLAGSARLRLAVEEHGAGRQVVLTRTWPIWSRTSTLLTATLAALCGAACMSEAWIPAAILAGVTLIVVLRAVFEASAALALMRAAARDESA